MWRIGQFCIFEACCNRDTNEQRTIHTHEGVALCLCAMEPTKEKLIAQKNKRVWYFDFLRVMATFAVILLHISASVFSPETQCSVAEYWFGIGCNAATRWAVPCFVMLSGALFLNSQKEITLKSLYGKYIVRLLVVFLTWTLLYTFLLDPSLFWIKGLPAKSLHLSFVYEYPYHLWFLPMLIGIYMMFPVLRLIIREDKVTNYFLVLWFLITLLTFIPGVLADATALFQIRLVTGFAGYALLGYRLHAERKVMGKGKLLVCFFLSLALMGVIIGLSPGSERFFDYLAPNVMLFSACVFLLGKYMDDRINRSVMLKKMIVFVRDDLLGVYLIHVFYIKLLYRPHFINSFSYFVSIPLFTILVFLTSLFTIKLLRKTPGIHYICS